MYLRKINDRIYLGVFRLEAMKMLDRTCNIFFSHAMNNTLLEDEYGRCFGLHFVRISEVGEGYIQLNAPMFRKGKDQKFCIWNFDEELIKTIVKSWHLYYSSFVVLDSMPTNISTFGESGIDPENQRMVADNFKKILNVWNDAATEEDKNFIGEPFDAFKQQLFKDAWEVYNKIIENNLHVNAFDTSAAGQEMTKLLQ